MLKKITILLLGFVVLSGCVNGTQPEKEKGEMFTLTSRVEKEVSTDKEPTEFMKGLMNKLNEKEEGFSTIYHLVSINKNSDLSYDLIDKFANENESLYKAFAPIDGKYTVYSFIASHWGLEYVYIQNEEDDASKLFHSLIVLKTNDENKIIDAYNYLFEWCDPPSGTRLFMTTEKDVFLENNFDTRKLNFKNYSVEKWGWDSYYREASEGILDIVPYMRIKDMKNKLEDDSSSRMREVSIRHLFEETVAPNE